MRIKKGGTARKLGDLALQEKLEIKSKLKIFLKTNQCKLGEVRALAELEEVEDFLTEKFAQKNVEEIKSQIGNMESIDGKFCQVNLWKLKKRICPKAIDPPMGKRNEDGLLITAPNLLKELYLQTYQKKT